MRASDGIAAYLLHRFQSTFPHFIWHSNTQTADILMEAHTLQLHILAVKIKTCIGFKADITKAKACLYFVNESSSAILHLSKESIERRSITAPKLWTLHRKSGNRLTACAVGFHSNGRCHFFSISVKDGVRHSTSGIAFHLGLHLYSSICL